MKKTIIILTLLCIYSSGNAQDVRFDELSVEQKGDHKSYLASDGAIYRVGDKIKIGKPSSGGFFTYIYQGDGILLPVTNLSAALSGTETAIKKITVWGNKRVGYSVTMRTVGYSGVANYGIQFENALTSGEIVGYGLNSDQALAELKKAKDKLDLGLISQEEFDKLKAELSVYIK